MVGWGEYTTERRRENGALKGINWRRVVRSAGIGALVLPATSILRDKAFYLYIHSAELFYKLLSGTTQPSEAAKKKKDKDMPAKEDGAEDSQASSRPRINLSDSTKLTALILWLISTPVMYYLTHAFWVSAGYILPTAIMETGSLSRGIQATLSMRSEVAKMFLLPTTAYLMWLMIYAAIWREPLAEDLNTLVLFSIGVGWYRWMIPKARDRIHGWRNIDSASKKKH